MEGAEEGARQDAGAADPPPGSVTTPDGAATPPERLLRSKEAPASPPEREAANEITLSPSRGFSRADDSWKHITAASRDEECVYLNGWLLKAFGGSSTRTWKRRWVYLLGDKLCWALSESDAGQVERVRCLSLDRIPVRPSSQGYGPEVGVRLVQSKLFAGSGGRIGCMFSITSGSKTHHFCADDPEVAEAWVAAVKETWLHCVSHASRTLRVGPATGQVHRQQMLLAENDALRSDLASFRNAMTSIDQTATARIAAATRRANELELRMIERTQYKICVKTGKMKGASTDARVYIEMVGKGDGRASGTIQLIDNEENTKPFGRGQLDTFLVDSMYLGGLAEVTMWHDGSGHQPHWYCEFVKVVCCKNGHAFNFPCGMWLSAKAADRRIKRTLYIGRVSNPTAYEIVVFTGDVPGASTDANVYVQLHGERSSSGIHFLSNGPDDFQRGLRNEFRIEDVDVGPIESVTIGHDNTGYGPMWFLDNLTVTNSRSGFQAVVPGRCWFGVGHQDSELERRLPVSGSIELKVEYIISCVTSDVRGAGTDADVFVILHGANSDSVQVMLPSAPEDFERGSKSVFVIAVPSVGDLARLTIGHNNKGPSPSWHLDYVEVVERAVGKSVWFPCKRWLSSDLEDGMTQRTLAATDRNPEEAVEDYKVEVVTSNIRGAGTDSNIWLVIHGVAGSSSRKGLRGPLEAFGRGCHDTFVLKRLQDLGTLQRIEIGHDGSGSSPAWHLDHVTITPKKTGKPVKFLCRKWFGKGVGDGKAERELLPEGHQVAPELCTWEVVVYTANVRGAGTDALVYVEIRGPQGTIGPRKLESEQDNFERGKMDVFHLEDIDIGELRELSVWHDDSGQAPSWCLDMVEVKNATKGVTWWFPANRWLSADHGLKATLQPSAADPRSNLLDYEVAVHTGDVKGASTDAGVTVEIIGALGSSGPRHLMAQYDTFERGARDEFHFTLPDLGPLQKVVVTSDGKGEGPAWFLEQIEITPQGRDTPFFFPGNIWLEKGSCELEVAANDPRKALTAYDVSVITSNIRKASTDANVFVQVFGSQGNSREIPLHSTQPDPWERGQVDECRPIKLSVGVPQRIRVWHDGKGASPAWHLEQINLISRADGTPYYFPCGDWLNQEVNNERILHATSTDPLAKTTEYEITVVTSDIRGASTDASVTIELIGTQGRSGPRLLESPRIPDPFERGSRDVFHISCKNVGEMKSCKIGHDSRGRSPGWHLSHIKVLDTDHGTVRYFPCERWLDKDHGDGETSAVLAATTVDPSELLKTYQVRLHTSDLKGAGLTAGSVSVVLAGSGRNTDRKVLVARGKSDFQRGQVDVFDIVSHDIGNLETITIGFDNSANPKASWHCKQIDVKCPGREWVAFPCNRWFDAADDGNNLQRVLHPEGSGLSIKDNTFQVVVHTSDIKGAGCAAAVAIELLGPLGTTGVLMLEDSQGTFERGKVDHFTLIARDVGNVDQARVIMQGAASSTWHLEMIEVFSEAMNRRFYFDCNSWLGGGKQETVLAALSNDPKASKSTYKIMVHTSDVRGAGCDGEAHIEMHGTQGSSGKIALGGSGNHFERDTVDEFIRTTKTLGDISRIVLGHSGRAWHVEQVDIVDLGSGKTYYFDCSIWLDAKNGTSRGFHASSSDPKSNRCKYKITVTTSDIRGAGTDASVYIIILGEKGESGKQLLDTSKDNFERSMVDTFFLKLPDLGPIHSIRLGHDNSGPSPAWHCDSVEIVNTSTGQSVFFRVNKWFDIQQLEREFSTSDSAPATTEYDVVICTGKERGSGCGQHADVTISILGDKSAFGPYTLDAKPVNFQRGCTDTFTIEASDVGNIQHLEISQNDKSLGSSWFVESVEVINRSTGTSTFLPFHGWLDRTRGMSAKLSPGVKTDPELPGNTSPASSRPSTPAIARRSSDGGLSSKTPLKVVAPLSRQPSSDELIQTVDYSQVARTAPLEDRTPPVTMESGYQVTFQTRKAMCSGTNGQVSFDITGVRGSSGYIQVQSSKKNFARGSTDSFYFPKLPYLGNLSQIRVYIEPKGAQLVCAGWDLETVTVTHVPTNTTWAAYHGNRIDKNCGHMAILTPMPGVLSYGEHNEGVAPEGNDHGSDVRRKAPSN